MPLKAKTTMYCSVVAMLKFVHDVVFVIIVITSR